MSSDRDDPDHVSALASLNDELKLQAWLARAEFRNPSLKHDAAREEVSKLASIRDELRVQLHLGRLDAGDEFERIEQRWAHVKHLAGQVADDVEDGLHDALSDIRDTYRAIRGMGG